MKNPEKAIRHCYSTWGKSYYDDYYSEKASYPPIHKDLIRKELKLSGAKTLLDAGCGPGSILRDLTDLEMELLENELKIIAEVRHPYILRCFSLREDKWNYYIVTEFCEGGNLYERILG